jgi:hypothetical protein
MRSLSYLLFYVLESFRSLITPPALAQQPQRSSTPLLDYSQTPPHLETPSSPPQTSPHIAK